MQLTPCLCIAGSNRCLAIIFSVLIISGFAISVVESSVSAIPVIADSGKKKILLKGKEREASNVNIIFPHNATYLC